MGLSPAPARFSHFFLLNDFSPLSRSLEQAKDLPAKGFLLPTYRRRYFLFVSMIDLVGVLATTGKTSAVAGYTRRYKYTKIQEPRFRRNYIIARYQKSDLHGLSFQSSPKINRMLITRPFAYNQSLQQPNIAVLLYILFTRSKVINAFNRHVSEKL